LKEDRINIQAIIRKDESVKIDGVEMTDDLLILAVNMGLIDAVENKYSV
jgi:hypothetical protein